MRRKKPTKIDNVTKMADFSKEHSGYSAKVTASNLLQELQDTRDRHAGASFALDQVRYKQGELETEIERLRKKLETIETLTRMICKL